MISDTQHQAPTKNTLREFFACIKTCETERFAEILSSNNHSLLEATDSEGRTPIMVAAFFGHAKMVDDLIMLGASTSTADSNGRLASNYLENIGESSREAEVRMSYREATLQTAIDLAKINMARNDISHQEAQVDQHTNAPDIF